MLENTRSNPTFGGTSINNVNSGNKSPIANLFISYTLSIPSSLACPWYAKLESINLSHSIILLSFKAGTIFSWKCWLLDAAKRSASAWASISILSLCKMILLISSAILIPPGSLVVKML